MSRMPPRLIQDVRRRRLIGAIAFVVVAGAVLLVGSEAFCHFRDDLRADALQELAKAEERLTRIDEISSVACSRYCGDWTNLVERTSAQLQDPGKGQAGGDSLALSRSQNYQREIVRLTNEYCVAAQKLGNDCNAFSEVIDRGRAVSVQMEGVARNVDILDVEPVPLALVLLRRRNE